MASHGISGDEVKERLQSLRDDLKNCIEPQFGLLDKLEASKVLIIEERLKILSNKSEPHIQCDVLLNIMQRKTPKQCEQFLVDLKASGQKHVVNFIVQNARRFNSYHTKFCHWPLEEIHRERISSKLDKLVNGIECKNNLLIDALVSCHCINDQQSQSIRAAPTSGDMNRKLLTILLRRSIKDYNKFVKCLEKSGMQHVVQEFHLDIGDVGPISSSEPSGPGGNVTSSDVTDTHNPVPFSSSLAVSSSSASAAPLKSFQSRVLSKELPETVARQASSQQAERQTKKRKLDESETTAPPASSQTDVITLKTTQPRLKGEFLFSLPRPPTGRDVDTSDDEHYFYANDFGDDWYNRDSDESSCDPYAEFDNCYENDDCPRPVAGVAIVGKNICVVYNKHHGIYTHDVDDASATDFIDVRGMTRPRDMVGDSERRMLFVNDYECCDADNNYEYSMVIWRVSIDTKEVKNYQIRPDLPLSISLADTRLLVTSSSSLVILNSLTGHFIKKIPLPDDENRGEAKRSFESDRETFIVWFEKTVIEMDYNGKEMRVFKCEKLLSSDHWSSDSVGGVFVADFENQSIFMLDKQLEFLEILLDNGQLDHEGPRRLNYDKQSNKLAVGLKNGHVLIFKIFENKA